MTTSQTFESVQLDASLRDALLARLAADHAAEPFPADDPRVVVRRVGERVSQMGLETVRIRGTVSVAGAEVDHVWLAVAGDRPWVLDATFPLLEPAFVGLLASYVAGTTTSAQLAAIAVGLGVERRVVGTIPPRTTYRGLPYWGVRRN